MISRPTWLLAWALCIAMQSKFASSFGHAQVLCLVWLPAMAALDWWLDYERERKREEGLVLPGWTCHACRAFNGSARENLTHCRACDAPKTSK